MIGAIFRHERYLGMWSENQRYGPGIVITSAGTYSEATFINGHIAVSNATDAHTM